MGAIFTDSRRISETQRFRNPRDHWGRGFVAFLVSLVAFYKK